MKKKLGILTLNGRRNYGNVLQNYALQCFFEQQGFKVETFWYEPSKQVEGIGQKILIHLKEKDLMKTLSYHFLIHFSKKFKLKDMLLQEREVSFDKFMKKYITYSNSNLSEKFSPKINDEYESIFVGSDQVWGLSGKNVPRIYFLPFVVADKRNAFAASFGFSELPVSKFSKEYSKNLVNMNNISVREQEGADLVYKLTGRSVKVLLDPTLLLTEKDWLLIADKKNKISHKKFLLTYFLGEKKQLANKLISMISKKYDLNVVNLNDITNKSLFSISPQMFITLFKQASFILTDSFHGTVFSLIFEKPFIVLDRQDSMVNMNSRIITLLRRVNLLDRFVTLDNDSKISELIDEKPSFIQKREEIEKNRVESQEFLKMSLALKKGRMHRDN